MFGKTVIPFVVGLISFIIKLLWPIIKLVILVGFISNSLNVYISYNIQTGHLIIYKILLIFRPLTHFFHNTSFSYFFFLGGE